MSSITGIVAGIWVAVAGATDGNVTVGDVLQTARTVYAIEQKTEQGTWGASAHEESYQIIKDTVRRIGNEQ
jgi:hypothetical protein